MTHIQEALRLRERAKTARQLMDEDLNEAIRKAVTEETGKERWPGDVDPLTAVALDVALETVLAQLIQNAEEAPS